MSRAVKLSDELFQKAFLHSKIMHRSTAGQIEYWARIGQIAEENSDLSYSFIRDILFSIEEEKNNLVSPYVFGEGDKH